MKYRTLRWGALARHNNVWLFAIVLTLAPFGAMASEIGDGGGRSISRNLTGTSGTLLNAGNLLLDGAAGQAAAGFSFGGSLDLTHGAFAALESEGDPEGEGEGGEGEPEGEGETELCSGQGPSVSAELGESVCLGLPGSCPVDPVDPLYQWFKDGSPDALIDQPGVLTGVNSPTLCFEAVTLEDSGVYTLNYESGNKALLQYSVELQVNPAALPLGNLGALIALAALLACCAVFRMRMLLGQRA